MSLLKPKWLFEMDEFATSKNYRVHVHTITMGDVEDPDIYVAEPIYQWQQTEKGKWVMGHSIPSPTFHKKLDYTSYGYEYHICAYLNEKDYTYWKLKYE